MERNTVSEGFLIRYDVRNGRYKPNYGRVTGTEHAMGTYTPRILRGTQFYIGPPSSPQAVQALASTAAKSPISYKGGNSRHKNVYVIRNEERVIRANERTDPEAENILPQFQSTEIFKLIQPLFYLMAVFGLFYPTCPKHCRHGTAFSKCYGLFVVLVVWTNLFRLLSCLSPSEWQKPGVVLKLSILGWFIQGAISALFCFWAWHSNSFAEVFLQWNTCWKRNKLRLKSRRNLRLTTLACSICGYVLLLILLILSLYGAFSAAEIFVIDRVRLRDCPVNIGTGSVLLTIIFSLSLIFTTAAWILPLVQLYLICSGLVMEYQHFNHTLKTAIDEDNSVHRYLEGFRQRHLSIGYLTLTVDRMMSSYSSVIFAVNSLTFLALMGDLCLHPSTGSDVRLTSAVLMAMSAFALVIFLYSCASVNTLVSIR